MSLHKRWGCLRVRAGIGAAVFVAAVTAWHGRASGDETSAGGRQLLGFLHSSRQGQLEHESRAVRVPQPDSARRTLRRLTEEPHVAGTPQDYETALYVRDELRKLGFDAKIVEYHVLLNYPLSVSAHQLAPEQRVIPLFEEGHVPDKDSFSSAAFPAFHGYGASGRAVGQVVYANYGRVEDFDKLEAMGV